MRDLQVGQFCPAPSDPPGIDRHWQPRGYVRVLGALEYIEWVGEIFGVEHAEKYAVDYTGQRLSFKLGMSAICNYEFELGRALIVWMIPG